MSMLVDFVLLQFFDLEKHVNIEFVKYFFTGFEVRRQGIFSLRVVPNGSISLNRIVRVNSIPKLSIESTE